LEIVSAKLRRANHWNQMNRGTPFPERQIVNIHVT